MKGYTTERGYEGYIPSLGTYMLFDTEGEYNEYYNEIEN